MFKLLKDKKLYKNVFLAGVVLILLFVGWLKYLAIYTNHDDFILIPELYDIEISSLDSLANTHGLRYEIIDSIFDKSKPKGVVINQDPLPNTKVKENRKIYLTINSLQTRKVYFPDIFDLTLRQAVRKLNKNGLEVGNLTYRSDIAINKILSYKVNGIIIEIGQELYHGTTVDLIVGKGLSNEKILVPNLIGLLRAEANVILKSTSLNIGLEYFNTAVVDSNSAIIYKQYPSYIDGKELSIGSPLDLYFEVSKNDTFLR
jgi:eukaryotic-like serine/threonine-protein kinase